MFEWCASLFGHKDREESALCHPGRSARKRTLDHPIRLGGGHTNLGHVLLAEGLVVYVRGCARVVRKRRHLFEPGVQVLFKTIGTRGVGKRLVLKILSVVHLHKPQVHRLLDLPIEPQPQAVRLRRVRRVRHPVSAVHHVAQNRLRVRQLQRITACAVALDGVVGRQHHRVDLQDAVPDALATHRQRRGLDGGGLVVAGLAGKRDDHHLFDAQEALGLGRVLVLDQQPDDPRRRRTLAVDDVAANGHELPVPIHVGRKRERLDVRVRLAAELVGVVDIDAQVGGHVGGAAVV